MTNDFAETQHLQYEDVFETDDFHYGYLKCRLVHMNERSFVVPDVLMVSGSKQGFYSPQFFYPNQIAFFGEGGSPGLCRLRVEITGGAEAEIVFFRARMTKHCADNSFIYKCAFRLIEGGVQPPTQGTWRRRGEAFELSLYHHTNAVGEAGIRKSGEIWNSPWNIQGTQKLKNIAYGYFTSIPKLDNVLHLMEIAMAENGSAYFLPTNAPNDAQLAHSLPVYKRYRQDIDRPMRFWVDVEVISPSHLWLHRPRDEAAYYEVVLPKVFRVGVNPDQTIPIKGTRVNIGCQDCKTFMYVIVGDADTEWGLTAPFHEEETFQLAKIDVIPTGSEIIGTWYEKQNSYVFPHLAVEMVELIKDVT